MMEYTGLTQKDLAKQLFDLNDKNFSNKIYQGYLPFYEISEWAIHKKVDLNWLILGKKTETSKDRNQEDNLAEPNLELIEQLKYLRKRIIELEAEIKNLKESNPMKEDEASLLNGK